MHLHLVNGLPTPIKSQQKSLSRERERIIQGIQEPAKMKATGHRTAVYSVLNSFGEDEVEITSSDSQTQVLERYPRTSIQFGPSTSFSEGGRQLAESYTLNRRQAIALQLLCRQLDQLDRGEGRGHRKVKDHRSRGRAVCKQGNIASFAGNGHVGDCSRKHKRHHDPLGVRLLNRYVPVGFEDGPRSIRAAQFHRTLGGW